MTFLLTKTPILTNIDTTHDILNNFPVGLIIFEKDILSLGDGFKISFSNRHARRLLPIPKDNIKKFLSLLPKYKEYNTFTQHETDNNLQNHILNKDFLTKETGKTFISPNNSHTLIYVKVKHYHSKILVTVDNYTDAHKNIQNQFIQSIGYQYLLTLYHEINNPLNSLINTVTEIITMGSCNVNHKKRIELLNFLIQFFLKNFILYFQIKTINKKDINVYNSQTTTINLKELFCSIGSKFSKLLSYKQITHNENLYALDGLNVHLNYFYFKNLIKMIYMYLYHRNEKGGSFMIRTERIQCDDECTKVKVVFTNGKMNETMFKYLKALGDVEDKGKLKNKIQTIDMIEEIITVLAGLLKIKIDINVNLQPINIAIVINAYKDKEFGNESELNEFSPVHFEKIGFIERVVNRLFIK